MENQEEIAQIIDMLKDVEKIDAVKKDEALKETITESLYLPELLANCENKREAREVIKGFCYFKDFDTKVYELDSACLEILDIIRD